MSSSRSYPALEVSWPDRPDDETVERLLADLDDTRPTAIEDHDGGVRVFFTLTADRDLAAEVVGRFRPAATCIALTVSDEAWAERSQAALAPIRVGRVIVCPPWATVAAGPEDRVVIIQPSMGFGTGHHPSTRLCLGLLQDRQIDGCSVLDAGTGSGVLAIAAWRLGAGRVLAIDCDLDALTSARENVERNTAGAAVVLQALDLSRDGAMLLERFDVITANLTGAMLQRFAATLAGHLTDTGRLVASGFQRDEEGAVRSAFRSVGLDVSAHAAEADWVAISASPIRPTGR